MTEVRDTVGGEPFAEVTVVSYGDGGRTTIRDVDGDTTVTATREGDVLHVRASGPKQITNVEIAPVAGAPATVAAD